MHSFVGMRLMAFDWHSAGNIQNGRLRDENARGREHAREADGQDLQADGPE